ncbi:MAG: glycosyltransferase family 2 protein [Deltaproteobacteria bacterium]|jgi:glycosyltransferase involved in cell wall biosynthesis|nr:glycosyltransferase family 2 protein [Deltaproteobacteria bacterium]
MRAYANHKPTLGLLMIARDEEKNLSQSLIPLTPVVDEAIFLDTGSRDQSVALAEKAGAKVYHLPWPQDFSVARNAALAKVTADYVLWLDADNAIEPKALFAFKEKLTLEPTIYFGLERIIPQNEEILQIRVFPRKPDIFWEGKVHEQLAFPKTYPIKNSDLIITHWGYADPILAKRKGERNLALLADKLEETTDPYQLYQTGRTLFNLKKRDLALVWLTAAVEKAENPALLAHSLILISRIQASLGDKSLAVKALERLTSLRPKYGPGHYFLGRMVASDDFLRAIKELKIALSLDLADPGWGATQDELGYSAGSLLGQLLVKVNDIPGAIAAYKKAIAFNPSRPGASLALARLGAQTARPELANEVRGRLAERNPGFKGADRRLKAQGGGK